MALMGLAACHGHVDTLPPPPKNTQTQDVNIAVPVLCKVTIKKGSADVDEANTGLPLEQQNTILRKSLAQQKAYIIELESGVVACGGAID